MNARGVLKTALIGSVDAPTSRHTALLPSDARDDRLIFELDAPYRIDTTSLVIELFTADARFRRLLTDRELGDFITCVAVRREQA